MAKQLAAGRVKDIEASISGQNQVDIEVDIRAGGGPPFASLGPLLALGPPLDPSGAQCRVLSVPYRHTFACFPLKLAPAAANIEASTHLYMSLVFVKAVGLLVN